MKICKQFCIIGNMNAITYKEVFPLIKENKIWLGATNFNNGMYFQVPADFTYTDAYKFNREQNGIKVNRISGVCWFTNLDHGKRHKSLDLMTMDDNIKFSKHKQIRGNSYPKYDNYDAIEVCFTDAIPSDYPGVMGVPISFLDKYCSEQFDIIDINPHFFSIVEQGLTKLKQLKIAGQKDPYARILIKHKERGDANSTQN